MLVAATLKQNRWPWLMLPARTGFAKTPPLPKEFSSTIANARDLPRILEELAGRRSPGIPAGWPLT